METIGKNEVEGFGGGLGVVGLGLDRHGCSADGNANHSKAFWGFPNIGGPNIVPQIEGSLF